MVAELPERTPEHTPTSNCSWKRNGEELREREHERRGRHEREEAWRSLAVESWKRMPENTAVPTDGTRPRRRTATLGGALAPHSCRPPRPARAAASCSHPPPGPSRGTSCRRSRRGPSRRRAWRP